MWQVVRVMVEVLQDFALEGQSKYEIAVSFAGVLDGLLEAPSSSF